MPVHSGLGKTLTMAGEAWDWGLRVSPLRSRKPQNSPQPCGFVYLVITSSFFSLTWRNYLQPHWARSSETQVATGCWWGSAVLPWRSPLWPPRCGWCRGSSTEAMGKVRVPAPHQVALPVWKHHVGKAVACSVMERPGKVFLWRGIQHVPL